MGGGGGRNNFNTGLGHTLYLDENCMGIILIEVQTSTVRCGSQSGSVHVIQVETSTNLYIVLSETSCRIKGLQHMSHSLNS